MKTDSDSRLAAGLMSGTSLDGIDAALVEISEDPFRLRTLATLARPFEPPMRDELMLLAGGDASVDSLLRAHVALGHHFADAVEALLREAGTDSGRINVIGCHGQTVRHLPEPARSLGREVRGTMQIGDAATLAERTGVTVVSDFRARDMAAGGQGAPLVPYLDFLLFADPEVSRVALNIGGITNVTFLPAGTGADEVIALDTGPGNMLIDLLARETSNGQQSFDRDGEIAARGKVNEPILEELLAHPFLSRKPPKSTGREEFGEPLLQQVRARGANREDLMATLTSFTARAISDAIRNFWPGKRPPDEVVASGGGVHNRTLMGMLAEQLASVAIRLSDGFGVPADFKEAVAFAVLADATLRGRPANLPSATGARRPVILGQITPSRE